MILAIALAATMTSLQEPIVMKPIPVEVVRQGESWQLLRGGKPYFVRGVGGWNDMPLLVKMGGNSVRTWGAENMREMLDEAHRNGVSVTLGIWLGHTAHGFSYTNPEQVQKQFDTAKGFVQQYKDHPALLAWGLGNEMEVNGNDTPELWKHVNDLAKMIDEVDGNHPTLTVVAEISEQKIANLNRYAPDLDMLGVNSYGGIFTLGDRLRQFGWKRPYMVTEFGPLGPWERAKTAWEAALEQTSTEKASTYLEGYTRSIKGQPGFALGSYAFLWGHKQEHTPTWFGMFLPTGERTESIDVMSYLWTGKWPEQRTPKVETFEVSALSKEVGPGEEIIAAVKASDPNGDPLTVRWELRVEVSETFPMGEGETIPKLVESPVNSMRGPSVRFKAPTQPGPYRLYMTVTDGKGNAGSANAPFKVRG